MHKCWIIVCLSLLLGCSSVHAELYLQGIGEDHRLLSTNERFYDKPDRAFIGEDMDFSGVGQSEQGGWATMISPRYFLSATHAHPGAGNRINFWEGNNQNDPKQKHTYIVDDWGYHASYDGSGAKGLGSDLWLGRLTEPLKPEDHIAYYPVPAFASDEHAVGVKLFVLGKTFKLGLSRGGAIVDDYEIEKTRTIRYWFHKNPGEGMGASDCYLIGGDSGGPSFMLLRGRLALVGIHFTNNQSNGKPDPEDPDPGWSGDSFVPYYLAQLNAKMEGEKITSLAPESSKFWLWALPGIVLLMFAVVLLFVLVQAIGRPGTSSSH